MPGQLFEGRNLDEAVENAARGLGVERFRIAYHIVSEKRGFLGGTKRVVIEAGMRPFDEIPEENMPPVMPVSSNPFDTRAPRRGAGGRSGGRERGDRGDRDRGGRGGRDRGDRSGNRSAVRERRPERPPIVRNPNESDFAFEVRQWCEKLFDNSGLALSAIFEEGDGEVRVMLSGPDTRKLTHRDGELLDSIQVIANKTRIAREGRQRIEFDCEGFKEKRSHELEEQALALADVVRREGGEQILPAMSPIERRIVHLALQQDPDVMTESRGDGFFKRVAIIPRKVDEGAVAAPVEP